MKVSFVIPSYNCAAFLPHAVKSCQEQSHPDIEIVIIDDCSTDMTEQYINWLLKQGDKRIIYRRNGKNMGRSYSRNLGNQISTGGVICVLDGDDLSMPGRAEWTMKKLKKCQVCYGSATLINAIGIRNRDLIAQPLNKEKILKPFDSKTWLKDLDKDKSVDFHENNIVHSTMGFLREIALKYPYSEGLISDLGIDDWELQVRMIRDGVEFDFIPDIICAYRDHDDTVSKTRDIQKVMNLKSEILTGVGCNP